MRVTDAVRWSGEKCMARSVRIEFAGALEALSRIKHPVRLQSLHEMIQYHFGHLFAVNHP